MQMLKNNINTQKQIEIQTQIHIKYDAIWSDGCLPVKSYKTQKFKYTNTTKLSEGKGERGNNAHEKLYIMDVLI